MTGGPEETAKASLYLETTVVSYLVARPSQNVIVLGHQQITQEWWDERREGFEIYVSQTVLDEVARGDPKLAKERLERISAFRVLDATPRVEELTTLYAAKLAVPRRALGDAAHLAFAVAYEVDYLLTWNCAHLAGALVRRRLRSLNAELRLWTPVICTPEELMYDVHS